MIAEAKKKKTTTTTKNYDIIKIKISLFYNAISNRFILISLSKFSFWIFIRLFNFIKQCIVQLFSSLWILRNLIKHWKCQKLLIWIQNNFLKKYIHSIKKKNSSIHKNSFAYFFNSLSKKTTHCLQLFSFLGPPLGHGDDSCVDSDSNIVTAQKRHLTGARSDKCDVWFPK